jgi:hypothetical protein
MEKSGHSQTTDFVILPNQKSVSKSSWNRKAFVFVTTLPFSYPLLMDGIPPCHFML